MSTDVATFRIRFPEFADDTEFTDARIQLFIDDTLCYMGTGESRWCGLYDKAQCYLAAHLLSLGTGSESGDSSSKAGPVTSKSAGGVSVTRAANNSDNGSDFYGSTVYGQQFLALRDQCFAGVLVANCLV